jgi:PEP-CTERM motif
MKSALTASLALLLMLVGLASPASAAPVDVFFNGPAIASDPDTNFGISETDAITARDSFGIAWVTPDVIGSVVGKYDTSQSSVLDFSPDPPTSSLNRAREQWTVENVSGGGFDGTSYLLFTHTDPFMKSGVSIDYADANVGLRIDAADGWVIVVTSAGSDTFYYPAIMLNGIVADGDVSDPFDVRYVVAEALLQAPAGSDIYQLPELQIGRGFSAPVPEPGTAALLAAGLVALGMRRRAAK